MAYVYMIKNKKNNKMYIGSSIDCKRRWRQHQWYLRNNQHPNKHLQSSWNKYGEDSFLFLVIEECSDEEQFDREQYYIDKYKPFSPNGYNISSNAGVGVICEQEYKNENFIGEKHPNASLTNEEVVKIKEMLVNGYKAKEISEKYNYKMSLICKISSLNKWRKIGEEYNEELEKLKKKRIDKDVIDQAVKLRKEGYTYKEIGEKLNVNSGVIRNRCDRYLNPNKYRRCIICGKEIIQRSKIPPKYCKKCAKKIRYPRVRAV